jgi:hypothetical protein
MVETLTLVKRGVADDYASRQVHLAAKIGQPAPFRIVLTA